MTRPFLLCFLLAVGFRAAGQKVPWTIPPHSSLAYVRFGGGGAGRYPGGSMASISVVVIPRGTSWGGAFEHRTVRFKAKNLPRDYEPGPSFLGAPYIPPDEIVVWSLHGIREQFFPTRLLRAGIELGPSSIILKEMEFTPRTVPQTSGIINYGTPRNYDYTTRRQVGIGLSLRAKLELPLSTAFGLEAALVGNLNTKQSFVGFEATGTLGQVRDRIRPKKQRIK